MTTKISLADTRFKEYSGAAGYFDMIHALESSIAARSYVRAVELIGRLNRANDGIKKIAVEEGDEKTANFCFAMGKYLDMMQAISEFWRLADERDYPKAWQALQDAIGAHHSLGKFLSGEHLPSVSAYGDYLTALEKAYPYRVFSSIEFIDKKPICTICGRSPMDDECCHIPGELYWGEMACVEHSEIELLGVSLVENPLDKRCVVTLLYDRDNIDESGFRLIHWITNVLETPLRSFRIEETIRELPRPHYSSLGEDAPCPCQSGSSWGKCCSGKEIVSNPHWIVLLGDLLCPFWQE